MGRPTRRSPTVSGYQMERQLARRAVRCERIDERIYAGAHVTVEDHPVLVGATLVASVDGVAANQAATRIHRQP